MTDEKTANSGDEGQKSEEATELKGGIGEPAVAVATPDGEASAGSSSGATPREVTYKHGPEAQKFGWWWGTGRRKAAVARVRLRPGKGEFKINKRDVNDYFNEERDQNDAVAPLKATDTLGKLDVHVNVKGGGYTGQAGAVLLGVARALCRYDCSLESTLRDHNYLTRDARQVERKKPGQPGARKRFQFSKR